jgi:hypothetical protein
MKTPYTSKNTFDGLQFRILECLEEAKGVPLTALEISTRLHEKEYRHELYDAVVMKVTRAVHAMKDKGKVILSDARDRDGRHTYTLPQRMLFTPKPGDPPPANPVLKPEIAEKIVTIEKPPEKVRKGPPRVQGVAEKVLALIDNAPHPLTTPELAVLAADVWPGGEAKAKVLLPGLLYDLHNLRKQISKRSVKGRGAGVRFEYFTRKTGTATPAKSEHKQNGQSVERVQGVADKIVAILDGAPYPLAAAEIEDLAKDIWPTPGRKNRLATTLYALVESRRIFQQPSTKRVRGAKYEFYTRKTSRETPPKAKRQDAPKPVQQTIAPPDNLPDRERYYGAPVEKSAVFRPGAVAPVQRRQLNIEVPADKYDQIVAAAKQFEVPIVQFVLDAIDFAMSHTE